MFFKHPDFQTFDIHSNQRFPLIFMARLWRAQNSSIYIYSTSCATHFSLVWWAPCGDGGPHVYEKRDVGYLDQLEGLHWADGKTEKHHAAAARAEHIAMGTMKSSSSA